MIARDELNDAELAVDKFNAALDDAPVTPKAFDGDREAADRDARTGRTSRARIAASSSGWARTRRREQLLELWTQARRRLPRSPRRHRGGDRGVPGRVRARARRRRAPRAARGPLPRGRRGAPRRGDRASCSSCSATRRIASSSTRRSRACTGPSTSSTRRGASRRRWCSSALRPTRSSCCTRSSGRAQFTPAPRRLTEELWQKAIIHPREDRHVGAIFCSTLGALAAGTAQPITAFGLTPEGRTDLDRDPRAGQPHRQVRLRRARDRSGADGVAAGGRRRPARRQHGRPRRRAPAAGAVAARRCAADRQDRRARARVRGRQADGVPAARAVRDARASARCPSSRPRSRRRCSRAARAITAHDGKPFDGRRATRRRSSPRTLQQQVPGPLLEQVGELSSKLSGRRRQRPDLELARGDRPHREPRRLHRRERSRDRGEGDRDRGRERCRACRSRSACATCSRTR